MRVRLLGLLLIVLGAASAIGQSTQASLEAELLHRQLYLRGLWNDDKLKFDSNGQLLGSSRTTSWTLAGIDIQKVELKSGKLTLKGPRCGIIFKDKTPQRVSLPDDIRIEIAAPASGDYHAPLLAILSDLPNLVSTLPAWASVFADKPSAGASPSKASAPPPNDSLPRKIGGGVTPPKVLFAGEPQYTPAARELKLSGNVLVYLQVDTNGNPIHIRLLRPLGLGLDEAAIRAVETYRFTPAMSNGKPVIVEMNVEVNFQIF